MLSLNGSASKNPARSMLVLQISVSRNKLSASRGVERTLETKKKRLER